MANPNIDKDKLYEALGKAGGSASLKRAVNERNFDAILSSLSEHDAAELKSIISDREKTAKLLSSPEAKTILQAISKNGKR